MRPVYCDRCHKQIRMRDEPKEMAFNITIRPDACITDNPFELPKFDLCYSCTKDLKSIILKSVGS